MTRPVISEAAISEAYAAAAPQPPGPIRAPVVAAGAKEGGGGAAKKIPHPPPPAQGRWGAWYIIKGQLGLLGAVEKKRGKKARFLTPKAYVKIGHMAISHFAATCFIELELELIQTHMTQEPMLRVEVGACRFAQQTSTAKRY